MNKYIFFFSIMILVISCQSKLDTDSPQRVDFSKKLATIDFKDSLVNGKSYLSVYSDIYSYSEKTSHNLTATISIRNMDELNPIYIRRAEYFDTSGQSLHDYIQKPVVVQPLETINIIINETDESGGTGANFIFEWSTERKGVEPLFEAVMISTKGQQGLSFTTTGHRIE